MCSQSVNASSTIFYNSIYFPIADSINLSISITVPATIPIGIPTTDTINSSSNLCSAKNLPNRHANATILHHKHQRRRWLLGLQPPLGLGHPLAHQQVRGGLTYISFPNIHLVPFQPSPCVWRAQLRLCVVHREQAAAAERCGGRGALRAPHLGAAVPPGPAHHTSLSLHPHQCHSVSGRLT